MINMTNLDHGNVVVSGGYRNVSQMNERKVELQDTALLIISHKQEGNCWIKKIYKRQ
jgi:hypothetical protein